MARRGAEVALVKKVSVIGIGAGSPDYLTIQAINALNEVDVFFLIDKGEEKGDLTRLRREICERFVRDPSYRTVEVRDPVRGKSNPSYHADVEAWRQKRLALYRALIDDELKDGECGAFLVWGDPSLYDGTLSLLDEVRAAGASFACEVIPGISSVQALAARHRVALNRIGEAIQITTGRRLAAGLPREAENVVVMLDADIAALRAVAKEDLEIFWGAYLGTADEVLLSGKLDDVVDEIERCRMTGKSEKGWIMDTYLLRRRIGR